MDLVARFSLSSSNNGIQKHTRAKKNSKSNPWISASVCTFDVHIRSICSLQVSQQGISTRHVHIAFMAWNDHIVSIWATVAVWGVHIWVP